MTSVEAEAAELLVAVLFAAPVVGAARQSLRRRAVPRSLALQRDDALHRPGQTRWPTRADVPRVGDERRHGIVSTSLVRPRKKV